jgi:hypothetical protein
MDAAHPIPGSVFLRRVLLFLSLLVGLPGIAVLIFGVSHGALMSLAPLFLLLAAGGIVLGICTLVAIGMLATNPAHRTRANYITVAAAFIASASVLVPAFIGP